MKQFDGVFERTVGYALAFAKRAAPGLVLAGLFVAAARAAQTAVAWSWSASLSGPGSAALAPLASPLVWLSAGLGWFAAAWMAYLVVGWLQRERSGRKPGFLAAVGVALGAGLPLLALQLLLGLLLLFAPYLGARGVYLAYQVAGLVALALLLPAVVSAVASAEGFRDALGRLGAAFSAPAYRRFFGRTGFWAALAPLALWLLLSSWLGQVGLQLDLNRALEPQFYGFLFAETLRGFLTTVVGLPIVAAALRCVYDETWGRPVSATPTPPAA